METTVRDRVIKVLRRLDRGLISESEAKWTLMDIHMTYPENMDATQAEAQAERDLEVDNG